MLTGEFLHNLDAKGRLIIPSKLRDDLGARMVITRGLDGCLFLFPMDEWKILSEKMTKLPLTRQEARSFTRFFFSGAGELEVDKQGRIAIPANLQTYAGLEKAVCVVGVSNRAEIWSEDRWNDYQGADNADFEKMADLIYELDAGL